MSADSGIAPRSALTVPFALSIATAVLLVVASVQGLFAAGFYHDTSSIVATNRGSDLFVLIVGAPLLAFVI